MTPLLKPREAGERQALIVSALEYGARYCDLQAKKWAKEATRPQPDRDRLDREFRQEALANERAFEDRAHKMRMLLAREAGER